jgi:hypothetical protein
MTDDGSAYLWIVPAKVAGHWEFRESDGQGRFTLKLEQNFQHVTGTAGEEPLVSNARIRGSQLNLMFFENGGPTKVEGTVAGNRIDAQVTRGGKTSRYIGTRWLSAGARLSVLEQSGADAPCGEHAEVLSDLGARREQRQLLLVDLLDFGDRCVSLFGDGFLRRLMILGVGERMSRGGHRKKPPSAS